LKIDIFGAIQAADFGEDYWQQLRQQK